ncbi:DUF2851 family protein [Pedobacter sp. BS3]|uniref:DUF2851 family protein n=1 Tax=Pedobacter sp. BS3 TaxID=2567937 RepID=UPI0011EF01A7|nr:DUF2851 family protein [Pedobacter sp. BS3]TZF82698.1 DUF2851 family protein [Pedobacter sp. BS3]
MDFSEDLLHFVWKFRLFDTAGLETTQGDRMEIISPGIHNTNSGPDFEQAKIRINDTLWAGNVEMHLRSSDWFKHSHQQDKAYDNVILHVVFVDDMPAVRSDGTAIATLVLQHRISPDVISRYSGLMQNMNWIPCEHSIRQVDDFYISTWLSRVLIERFEHRSEQVLNLVNEYKGSWDDAFYITLARNFGFKTNALPFELLARSLPQQILARYKNSDLQIEALVFGQAGLLENDFADGYGNLLKTEYRFLAAKHQLSPIDGYLWKFMRLRPQNFPTIRLAQFAALVLKSNHLFSKIIEITDVKTIRSLFTDLPVNAYWETHYRFDKESKTHHIQLGADSIDNILLNTVALFLFSYGRYIGKERFVNRAIALLEDLPSEINHIVNRFYAIGVKQGRADRSQALLQLKKQYCDQKKCLTCGVGVKLIHTN